jgi:hypothetical protein
METCGMNDRKFSDDPTINLVPVAITLLDVPIDQDVIGQMPVEILQEFARTQNHVVLTKKQALYVRSICAKWREGVSNGQYPDTSGPLAVAMTNDDFVREVIQPLMFFNKPESIKR